MVLDDEGAFVAEALRLDDVIDVVLEAGGAVDIGSAATLRLGRAEKSEPHRSSPAAEGKAALAFPPDSA